MKLHQVIVVEGEHDRRAVLNALEADIEITGGFALTEDLIQRLNFLQEKRGLIILTDPDYTGEVIRRCLQKRIPGVEHAYLSKSEAERQGDIGVENASPEAIRQALAVTRKESLIARETFTMLDLYRLHLTGYPQSETLRMKVAERLKIGFGNGKKFCKQLNTYLITPVELLDAIESSKELISP